MPHNYRALYTSLLYQTIKVIIYLPAGKLSYKSSGKPSATICLEILRESGTISQVRQQNKQTTGGVVLTILNSFRH